MLPVYLYLLKSLATPLLLTVNPSSLKSETIVVDLYPREEK